MFEYSQINWRNFDLNQLSPSFVPDEIIEDCYAFKSMDNSWKAKGKPQLKLNIDESKGQHIPGQACYRLIKRRSLLTKGQKAECLSAMKLIQKGYNPETLTSRQTHSLNVYKECHSKIIEENRLFLEYIKDVWHKYNDRILKCHKGVYSYSWSHWKDRLDRYLHYPQYYKELKLLSLNFEENEAVIDFKQLSNILEMGFLARFTHPNFKEPCTLRRTNLRQMNEIDVLNSQYTVSEDHNIISLAENYDFDVVISSSGLKRIINYTNTSEQWSIPVVIKEITQGNKQKKIVFIDKVLPKCKPIYHDLNYFAYKRLLKLEFCQYEAFQFPNQETPIYTDSELKIVPNQKNSNKKSINHNVSYRIWQVTKTDLQGALMKGKSNNENIKLLVRSKLDACEITESKALSPVIIRPKIEEQLQYGANICSKSELAKDWTSLFFRIYSNLYRARIYSPNTEVIDMEKCTLHKVNLEAQTHYNYRPILGLGVLQKIMAELMTFECGNYLLLHLPKHGSFVAALKESDQNGATYDLHADLEEADIDVKRRPNWLPIDVNYLLPAHTAFEKIPAVFHGFDRKREGCGLMRNLKNGVVKRKKKKKNNKKRRLEFLRKNEGQNV